jgi:3-hydroxyacyl-[acyl-carrier-protein] dehydratase
MANNMTENTLSTELNITQIMDKIPHRYPFLLIDKVKDINPGVSAVGIKNVTMNEQVFQGHFPGHPIFPGVLIIEAMAQTAGTLVVHSLGPDAENKLVYFMTIDEARFRKPVGPGDQMHIHVEVERSRGAVWKFKGKAMVDGNVHAEATFSAMIMDRN